MALDIQDLLVFIQASPTPFHCVSNMLERLQKAGFERLDETEKWSMQPGGKYVLTRNSSSILVFIHGKTSPADKGIRMAGAHTDSPCLKVKPNADIYQNGYCQAGVEVYGGVLLNPWFDRDLGLAGRVSVRDKNKNIQQLLLNIDRPVGMIPSLAIHLDREANNSKSVNAQKELPVLLGIDENKQFSFRDFILQQLQKDSPAAELENVLDYELMFYDIQKGSQYGIHNEFIASARLDNLLSCYCGMQALLQQTGSENVLLICNDHEEVGSCSAAGALGPMLEQFLKRMMPDANDYARAISLSMMISADNAHGIHPNYPDKHDARHGPLINKGPVIKVNANQRYASNSETQAIYRALCQDNNIPLQTFVVRSDMACGSTIGPITAAEVGVKTLDVGVPSFAMHSIRESAGSLDAGYLAESLKCFYELPQT